MSEVLAVRSRFGDYQVTFVEGIGGPLGALVAEGAQIVCDERVGELHTARIRSVVPDEQLVLFEAVEPNKSLDKAGWLLETLADRRLRLGQRVVAIGGGIVQDVTSFAASALYRGIDWVFFPTTLLAQSDSCIGGKTSINLGERKNLIGSFHPPSAVFIDPTFLDSLSDDDIRSGIGEILHYYVYAASPMLEPLMTDYERLLKDRAALVPHVHASLEIKRAVIEEDELDRGERQKFNYGHTFGHALESATGYAVSHGLAVTVGMDLANYVSARLGMLDATEHDRLHKLLSINLPAYDWASLDLNAYIEALGADKKNTGADLTCILCAGAGRLFKHTLPLDRDLRDTVGSYFAGLASA